MADHHELEDDRPIPKLLMVANEGNRLVSEITHYLSTIPTPVDVLEDLASIVAVTSSLIVSLNSDILEFSPSTSGQQPLFIHPLCVDISTAFETLRSKSEEAKQKKAFEPNEKGLVRTPRFAWFDIMGGQGRAARLRSRLSVEKYRVRVLIDAVRFKGLSGLRRGDCLPCFKSEEEEELDQLKSMLPIIVERLVGVQKDYAPRLQSTSTHQQRDFSATLGKKGQESVVPILGNDGEDLKLASITGKSTTMPSSRSNSVASSITVFEDSIEEAWLLRQNEREKELRKTRYIFGMKFCSTYQLKAHSFYVKPLPANITEIHEMQQAALGELSQAEHEVDFKKKILSMNDNAQWEIQKLLESRDKASSTDCLKRNWEVVGLQVRPRRKINASVEKKWWKTGKKPIIEWVLIIQGETLDHEKRVTPVKHENPWQKKEEKMRPKVVARAHGGDVLTHVGKRTFMPMEEAVQRMGAILEDLFGSEAS